MANHVRKLAEVQETAWTQASGRIIAGIVIFIVAAVLIYAASFFVGAGLQTAARVTFGLVGFAGLSLVGAAVYNGMQAQKLTGVGYTCPYCDRVNKFEAEPDESFDCEFCNRTVHFDGGVPVPIRTVDCPFCHTEHRVAVNVQRYVCDRCNRPLDLSTVVPGRGPAAAALEPEAAPQTFDVLLLAADRRRETEIAMKLQNILVVNLLEARRLMSTASTTTPLVVSHALPQRKAEAIRRQLQDVGATASLRPSNESASNSSRPS